MRPEVNNPIPLIFGNSRIKKLVYYYGALQIFHFIFLSITFINYLKKGLITLLAPPPAGGWQQQSVAFFLAMGGVDAVNALLSIIFVKSFIMNRKWSVYLGLIVLSVSIYSAIIYLYPVLSTGAFQNNLINYSIIGVLFLPVIMLYVLFIRNLFINK